MFLISHRLNNNANQTWRLPAYRTYRCTTPTPVDREAYSTYILRCSGFETWAGEAWRACLLVCKQDPLEKVAAWQGWYACCS